MDRELGRLEGELKLLEHYKAEAYEKSRMHPYVFGAWACVTTGLGMISVGSGNVDLYGLILLFFGVWLIYRGKKNNKEKLEEVELHESQIKHLIAQIEELEKTV
ncbi:V-type ATPase subunit a family protein [Pseudodesulfovibrio tunisiensis]|uniref:V-type ATPase subunit a family protein n=1 Tax=Pseudodesulfovibrio tunisiensis TaxID=463192 RepID=UPI001FB1B4B6|nr:V-type ATPase subunit a family protein [Pseudodesulfovibrio tunisiensis]